MSARTRTSFLGKKKPQLSQKTTHLANQESVMEAKGESTNFLLGKFSS